ncbi:MAG TPA: rRNA maturation RNase YbeY [Bacteroidales bacterium]|mgnify:FL=1|nr:rRNA maturation RNase YbeY [Bacteroidales bacterium]HOH22763.1 rRNA maturation RNase YbeY [Bacteroidales bacterium]HPB56977.1 rRNA maturation RNase YbeY [Bacteroidales bacterium]HPZ03303.1 rRNA maturation RNase YbeY [Bacteroidales bacterium]HQB74686.1 rRNA maturation RNase YbeY [Bacteroidales bacterium]
MIRFYSETDFNLINKQTYKNWLKSIIEKNNKRVGEINYIFCDDPYLLEINQKYLNHDYFTDIITFDYSEGKKIHGDIYISIDRVRENATLFNQTFDNELLRVLSHGVLHLCGFDDQNQEDKIQMTNQEDEAILLYDSFIKS